MSEELKMSEPKFTPGPWSILFSDKTKVVLEDKEVAVFVADTYAGFTKSNEEQEANADLIAAAPDMYELLEAMEREGNQEFPLNRIGDVLKKARGEK